MNISTPTAFAGDLYKKYKSGLLLFAAIYITGILTHLYAYTNKFFNYFELGNIFADMSFTQGDTVAQGRWFIPIGSNILTMFSMPLINGLLSLLYMSLAALMILDILKIRSALYSWMFGAAFVTFPGYACILAYGVNADAIAMAVFLCTLGGWVYYRLKGPAAYILAAVFIACGLGIYQTYLCLPIAMVYCSLFIEACREDIKLKPFVIKTLKAALMLAAGFIVYYVVLKISCVVTGVSLTDYHGVDSMTSFTPKGLAKGLVYTYGYFLSYFFSQNYIYTIPRIILNVIGAVVFLIYGIRLICRQKRNGRTLSAVALAVLLCFLPLGINATPFLMADRVGAGVDRYMIPSLMVMWGLLLKLMDMEDTGVKPVIPWLGTISCMAGIITSFIICNEAYHRLDAGTTATVMYFNRLAARIEAMPQYEQGYPLYFANSGPLMSSTYDLELPAYEAIKNMPGTEISPHYNERGVARYFRFYLHMPVVDAGEEGKEAIENSPALKDMPAYPSEGSIAIINDTIVVKLSESE